MTNIDRKVTRGAGLLENFLAKKRIKIFKKKNSSCNFSGRILDIGSGHYPLLLLESGFNERWGIDKLSGIKEDEVVTRAGVELISQDLEVNCKLSFEDNYFDMVTMMAVIEHLEPESARLLVSEIHRVLSPGGFCFLTTPALRADKVLRVMARVGLVSKEEIDEHKAYYNFNELVTLGASSGFLTENMQYGYFEMGMNIWFKVKKESL